MITVEQQSKLMDRIKTMSELEMASFCEEFIEHLQKNGLYHLVEDTSQSEQIDSLEDEVESLENEVEDMHSSIQHIESACDDVDDVEEFEDDSFEKLSKALKEIKKICSPY